MMDQEQDNDGVEFPEAKVGSPSSYDLLNTPPHLALLY